MGELAERDDKSIPFYNPEIFRVLKDFIAFLNRNDAWEMSGTRALGSCLEIDGVLAAYLESKKFDEAWDKIKKNSRNYQKFLRNLHVWFDAFQTLKLAHHLRDKGYGTVEMLKAMEGLKTMAEAADYPIPEALKDCRNLTP